METIDHGLIIVEDEPFISIMIEEMAHELGWLVIGSAQNEADALRLLSQCQPRVALLDINLGQATSLAVASLCRSRDISIVFTTGYSPCDVPSHCGDAPILSKPFSTDQLEKSLARALHQGIQPGTCIAKS